MKYSIEELGFILYNNRSVKGVVSNFMPKYNVFKVIKIEKVLGRVKSLLRDDDRMVELNTSQLDTNADDIIVYPNDIENLTNIIIGNIGRFSDAEINYLNGRGIGDDIIKEYSLLGLSSIKDLKHLRVLGATSHPTLSIFLEDGIENGGIIIPLFSEGKLINCAIRKIKIENDSLSDILDDEFNIKTNCLKYSLACPDIPVWGIDDIEMNSEVWITEGIFDMIALRKMGKLSVSCSSAMWSSIQLYQVLEKKPSNIVIVSDNDNVGLRVSFILREFFNEFNIPVRTIISDNGKDPAEHYFQNKGGIDTFKDIDITSNIIDSVVDSSFDFIGYMTKRKF